MKIPRFLPSRSISSAVTFRNRLTEHAEQLTKPETSTRTTIDPKDVEHHSKLSNKWWDLNGQLRALHAFNPLRVQFVRDGLANMGIETTASCLPLEGVKILDVGCGGGIFSEPLARIGAEVTGLDASSELIKTASEHAMLDTNISGRLKYVCTDLEHFAPENKQVFDAVVASEVIEHVDDKELFLQCCASIIKPGGSLFLTTFNKTLPSWLGGIIAAEHVLKIIPAGTHDWNKFISPDEMQRLLEICGCRTKLIHGIFYNPLKNEWSWTASTAINYGLHAVKTEKQK